MNRDNRSSSNDPTAEVDVDQSTQSAGGLGGGRGREEGVNRAAFDTPRRYDQPIEEDDDPVMPGTDATVDTKI